VSDTFQGFVETERDQTLARHMKGCGWNLPDLSVEDIFAPSALEARANDSTKRPVFRSPLRCVIPQQWKHPE
jgi:hypothetical protein